VYIVKRGQDYMLSTPPSIKDVLTGDECAFSIDPSTSKWPKREDTKAGANKTIPEITLHDGEVF